MKRIFLFSLLILAALGLPVAAVHAQEVMEPGCSQEMWGYLKDQANAVRARNKAYEREILHREQSTLYLTCFDQSMAVSSKLGFIFSDLFTLAPPPQNQLVMQQIAYPDWGVTQPTVAMYLDKVVTPEFNNWLDDPVPAPALFNFLPQWLETTPVKLTNQLTAIVNGTQQFPEQVQVEAQLASFISTDQSQVQSYNSQVSTIDALVKSLPTMALQNLSNGNVQYSSDISTLQSLIASIESSRGSTLGPLLAQLEATVSGVAYTCARADALWTELDPAYVTTDAGVFYPPEGEYYPFTPYYTLKDFLSLDLKNVQGGCKQVPCLATPDFVQELGDATDSAALKQALNDVGTSTSDLKSMQGDTSPLGYRGNSPLWPAPPTFFAKPAGQIISAQDVIDQM